MPTEHVFSKKLQFYEQKFKIFIEAPTEVSMEIMCFKGEYCTGFRRGAQL